MKVLIVDDNIAIQEIVSEILSAESYETLAVGNAKDALDYVRSFRPDLILLDINLPDMDGWSILRRLKEDGLTTNLKVIMFTADIDIGSDIFGLQDVVSGYIRKPFKGVELIEKIQGVMGQHVADRSKGKFSLKGLFAKKEGTAPNGLEKTLRLEEGKAYIFQEKKPQAIFDAAAMYVARGSPVLIITGDHPKNIRERWKLEETPIIWLTTRSGKAFVDPSKLGSLTSVITEFMEHSKKAIIVLEGLPLLILNNDFNQVLKMIHQIMDMLVEGQSVLLLSLDPRLMEEKDLALLERNMETKKIEE
ncbi:MAG: DUF835 domain-containing protein [Candidatus Methanomethylophilaceae archaeon]|jgi:DNA-binding response OmpR family regulator